MRSVYFSAGCICGYQAKTVIAAGTMMGDMGRTAVSGVSTA